MYHDDRQVLVDFFLITFLSNVERIAHAMPLSHHHHQQHHHHHLYLLNCVIIHMRQYNDMVCEQDIPD